jgi:hypothetical protein
MADNENTEQVKEAFDPIKFKQELVEMNKSYVDQVTQGVISQVSNLINTKQDAERVADEVRAASVGIDTSEFSGEIEALGLDEKGAKALVGLLDKVVSKKAPAFEREIISKVDQNAAMTKSKEDAEENVIKKYPQVTDRSSALWKRAGERFLQLSESVKNSPEGRAIAVELAASDLGIRAASPYQANSNEANPMPGGGQGKGSKVSDEQVDFAKSFGVKEDTFKKKLKLLASR